MKQHDDTETLRRYIRESLIVEFEGGIDYAGGGMGYFSGVGPETGRGITGAFRKALGDVGGAAKAVVGKTYAGAKRFAQTAASGALELLSAGKIKADYDRIHAEYDKEISAINSKYRDAIESSWKILGKNAAPLAAFGGLATAPLALKTVIENPAIVGAAVAIATAGGSSAAQSIANQLLGVLGVKGSGALAAKGLAGAMAGEKSGSAIRNESKKIRKNRIIIESNGVDLSPEKRKEAEELLRRLQAELNKAGEEIKRQYEQEISGAQNKFVEKTREVQGQLDAAEQAGLTPQAAKQAEEVAKTIQDAIAGAEKLTGSKLKGVASVQPSAKQAPSVKK